MKAKRVAVGFLSLLMVVVFILSACAGPAPPGAEKEVKIGLALDWTGPFAGAITVLGPIFLDYFHKYVNEEQGGIDGVKVKVLWADTGYKVPTEVSIYDRFVEQGIVLYVNHNTAANTVLKPKFEADKIPCLTTGSVISEQLYPPGWIFFDKNDYSSQLGGLLDWFMDNWKEDRPPKFAYLTWDAPLGRSTMPAGHEYAEKIGYEFVGIEYMPMVPMEVTAQLLRLQEKGADLVFGQYNSGVASVVLKDAYRLGLTGKIQFAASGNNIPMPEILELTSPGESEGMILIDSAASWDWEVPGWKLYNHVCEMAHGKVIKNKLCVFGGVSQSMIAVEAIRLALEEVGYEHLDGLAVKEYGFETINDFSTGGLTPPITYSAVKRRGYDAVIISQAQGGKEVALTDWIQCPDLMPPPK